MRLLLILACLCAVPSLADAGCKGVFKTSLRHVFKRPVFQRPVFQAPIVQAFVPPVVKNTIKPMVADCPDCKK